MRVLFVMLAAALSVTAMASEGWAQAVSPRVRDALRPKLDCRHVCTQRVNPGRDPESGNQIFPGGCARWEWQCRSRI
jgi:hypothetical protein